MTGPQGGSWMGTSPHGHPGQSSQPPPQDENGLQTRHMGLKVHYTFEKDQQNCLAKWPHVLQIHTIPIDERNAIGLVDLRFCLEAIAQCSPEIINQHDKDYAVYALDYAEEDTPLVGQGMLSWGLEQPGPNTEQKSVTGRVVKNMMAALRGGPPETLEVKLKLNGVPRMQRPQTSHTSGGYGSNAPTPTASDSNSEWNSFVQSNPNLGGSAHGPSMSSPGFPPARYGSPIHQIPSPAPDSRMDMYAPQPLQPVAHRNISTPPITHRTLVPSLSGGFFEPVPSSQGPGPEDAIGAPQARPSEAEKSAHPKKLKAKSTKKKSTGNPPGRPRKRARPDAGHTSAIEDATDADEASGKAVQKRPTKVKKATDDATDADEAPAEGPKKKRAKTTKANWPSKAPLNSAPGSLRVAASTSGSLRTMRPAASGDSGVGASHLQEIPRAPTPVPEQLPTFRGRAIAPLQPRRSSMADFDGSSRQLMPEPGMPGSSAQGAFSPCDSIAQSPYNAYTPEESSADIGSSPPVPRSTHSVRSSPPLSSPVLPTMMPMPQPDSGFMSGDLDEILDDYELPPTDHPLISSNFPPQPKTGGKKKIGRPRKAAKAKVVPRPLSRSQTAPHPSLNPFSGPGPQRPIGPASQVLQVPLEQVAELLEQMDSTQPPPPPPMKMVIQHEVPGDPQLLPKQTIYTPRPGSARAAAMNAQATGTNEEARQWKRASTEPNLQQQETPDLPTGPPTMVQAPLETETTELEAQGAEPCSTELHRSSLQQDGVRQTHQQQSEHVRRVELDAQDLEVHVPKEHEADAQGSGAEHLGPQELDAQLPEAQQPNVRMSEAEHKQQGQINQEVFQSARMDDPVANASKEKVSEQQTTTPAAPMPALPESSDDTDALLRLLNGPLGNPQDMEPGLPTMLPVDEPSPLDVTQSAYSEVIEPTSMAPAPPSDFGGLDQSEGPASVSLDGVNSLTKNMSRKKSIKEKLERAVQAGKMPTFCSNCGSISTPTWRKIWIQDSDGSPDTTNFSEEPGRITATIILEKDEDGKSTKYRTVKKTLGPAEDKSEWTEEILCNPCGLWLSKYRAHRPESKWETDFTPKTRDRGGRGKTKARSKKRKGQRMASAHPTSEAYYTTDPIGPDDQRPSPATDGEEVILLRAPTSEPPSRERGARSQPVVSGDSFDTSDSHASSTAQGPVDPQEDGMGHTRRLLFPSPKKDGQVKILGEVAVNIVRTSASIARSKAAIVEKENVGIDVDVEIEMNLLSTPRIGDAKTDLLGTPARPSTPPPKERPNGVFKTPTRPTPSHRPITRSVSKSIRRSTAKSPGQSLSHIHQTPTKTPRSSARLQNRAQLSVSNTQRPHAHFMMEDSFLGGMSVDFDSPFSTSLNQLLSEANDFTAGSDAHGLGDFELPNMHSDTGLSGHLESLDFGHFLTTDTAMPSSPPVLDRIGTHVSFEASDMDFSDWGTFGDLGDNSMDDNVGEDS
ncbi:unnamed protein product [Discula destructiva]